MPDNKKQGRSNKAMTFFVCFLAALAGLLFGLDIGVIAGAFYRTHSGMGGQLHDVWRGRRRCRQRLALL